MNTEAAVRQIVKRDGTLAPYNRERIATAIFKAMNAVGRPNRNVADAMAARVEAALVSTYAQHALPSVEDIQDVVENVLMEHRHTDVARAYIIYRHQRAMARTARADAFEVSDNVPYRKIYEMLRWSMDQACESIAAINRRIENHTFPDLIRASDQRYEQEVRQAAALLLSRAVAVRIVIVAGPSSSGKTTTTIKLAEALRRVGLRLKAINVDHYFFDLERHPIDEFGDHDYEAPEALDLELIDRHIEQLLGGSTVRTPHYDFRTGVRTLDVHEMSLAKDEILLIDSLHGLYDGMTRSTPAELKFRLYIETLGQVKGEDGAFMRWADNRLLRRMIRDRDHRNLRPMQTLTHWHYVRRSELQHIIPFIKDANFIVNSALPYELPILRHKLFWYVARARNRYVDNPKRLDANIRAHRIYDLLRPLRPVRDDRCVPRHSLLREFIGGSAYGY